MRSHEIRVVVIVVDVERESRKRRIERDTENFFFCSRCWSCWRERERERERVNLGEISACSFGISVRQS
ncbi:hypothetical protein VNO80_24340 [Phaseolus coccineus]|uniref:Uncharacterized protein n=1 Tax=Phaseolus coccineus TaxID=3886 RepID=A0AAN9LTE2_PHACN